MFDRVELNERGEFIQIAWAEEFRHAFVSAVELCRKNAQDRCRDETYYSAVGWFAERMAA